MEIVEGSLYDTESLPIQLHKNEVNNSDVPSIGLGTWLLSGQKCIDTVQNALSLGYRHIDTAQIYGNERDIGHAVQSLGINRDEIFLVTKLSTSNFRYKKVIDSTFESLDKLATDYIDLLLIHWPDRGVPLEETLDAMSELSERCLVRKTGLSNFPPSLVERAFRHSGIFCNQIEFHPYLSQTELIRNSRKLGYLVTAYCPLAKGRVCNDPLICDIASEHGKTAAQITLRWIVQKGIAAIPKSSGHKHLKENISIYDFELEDEEMAAIDSLERGLHLDPVSYMSKD